MSNAAAVAAIRCFLEFGNFKRRNFPKCAEKNKRREIVPLKPENAWERKRGDDDDANTPL